MGTIEKINDLHVRKQKLEQGGTERITKQHESGSLRQGKGLRYYLTPVLFVEVDD